MSGVTETRSTCPYCGVGCGVVIEAQGGQITGVTGDADHPANFGRLCSKGSTLHLTAADSVTQQSRLLHPMRRSERGATPRIIGWEDALDEVADRFAHVIQTRGVDAVGFYISGQLLTEDYHAFNKLARGLIGTHQIDTNSRLCMSSAVAGYKATLGADAPPCSYEDLAHAQTVFITGSNMAWAHPVLFRRLEDARRANPQQRWIVVDPRRTETAEAADLHLQIQPGTDVALCHGLLHLLLWEGLADHAFIAAHTTGFNALRDRVRNYTPAETARLTGCKEADIVQAARWFGGDVDSRSDARTPTLSLYCQGLNQSTSGTDKNAALINLHLATGQIGKPGAGPFSLTGQPNAMGGREVGGLANLLPGHRDVDNADHRAEVAALWGLEGGADALPATPGRTAIEMFQAAADGEIGALWIACSNPAQSLPDQATVRRALERCEFIVLQEAFASTATARYADLLLPATTWGEKDGTVTNSERRISRVRPAVPAAGTARHDWRIAVDVARRLETRLPRRRKDGASLFPFDQPEDLFNDHRESTRGRDLDITGLSYALLETQGPQQWPYPHGASTGTTRLYADGVFPTADGKARFADMAPRAVTEPRNAHYPFSLNTGRLRDQWHGGSRTGTAARLFGHAPEPVVELHPSDLARLRLNSGDLLRVRSKRGTVVLPALANDAVAPTQAFIAMTWGDEWLGGRHAGGVNALTSPAFCPQSKQPELKYAAVRIEKVDLPWHLRARAWLPAAAALQRQAELLAHCADFEHAACVPFGREGAFTGVMLRAAAAEAPPADWLAQAEALLGLDATDTLRYADPSRRQHRAVRLLAHEGGGARLTAYLLAGDTVAESWAGTLLQDELPAQAYGRALLSGTAFAPVSVPRRSPQVCNCFDVSQALIETVLITCEGSAVERWAAVQQRLKCGTNCGSCLPALRQLVAATPLRATILAVA